jgi:Bardet-Biedl syndrome 7 protein
LKKKGNVFSEFGTSLNEDIMNMFCEGEVIWTTCEYIMNMFENENDTHFYMATDHINHFVPACITEQGQYNTVLACQDRNVRVLLDSDMVFEQAVDGAATAVALYSRTGTDEKDDEGKTQVIYGTEDGQLGELLMDDSAVRKGWLEENLKRKSGITVLHTMDVTQDGVQDIVVGRDDGTLEVMVFDKETGMPESEFERDINESITSIEHGAILSAHSQDIVVATYSGKVLAFSHEVTSNIAHIQPKKSGKSSDKAAAKAEKAAAKAAKKEAKAAGKAQPDEDENDFANAAEKGSQQEMEQAAGTIRAMRDELDELRGRLEKEKEKYSKLSANLIAVEQQFKIKQSFKMLPDEACYLISVEIQIPLDVITLQSDVPVMLMDVTSNLAMVSKTPTDGSDGNHLLATYRCQDSTHRLEIKVRTVEGQSGALNVYVIPKMTPKTCQKATFYVKPLSLHCKVNREDVEEALKERKLNTLSLSGNFSLNEVHSWIGACLPDVPPRINTESGKLYFTNMFLKTFLTCEYSKDKAVFKSDSVSTISILKETITKEATSKKISINPDLKVDKGGVLGVLELMRPELDHHFSLSKRHSLIEALREIQTHEEDVSYLTEEYKEILEKADTIKAEFKLAPRHLDFLRGIVTDLYADGFKLQGRPIKNKIQRVTQVLDNYDYEQLVAVFSEER